MKILITGNMGYVGPCVARHLRLAYPNVDIAGFDTGFFGGCLLNQGDIPERTLDRQLFGDVRTLPDQVLEGVNGIVHLAALSNDPIGSAFEEATEEVNFRATLEIAERAKRAGVESFVFASSCSVYGSSDDSPRDEKSVLRSLSAYATSKVRSEAGLELLADSEFTVTCLRFATACGLSPRLRLDLVLNDFVTSALVKGEIELLSDGTSWRPLIHVKDMARAVDWALHREGRNGGDFVALNTGSDEWNFQVLSLARAVQKRIPGVKISIGSQTATDSRSYRVDFSRFRALAPDFQPEENLSSAIMGLLAGLRKAGFRDTDFRNSSFIRLNVLNELKRTGQVTGDLFWRDQRPLAIEAAV